MDTMTQVDALDEYLNSFGYQIGIDRRKSGQFSVHSYYPNGDISRDHFCHGIASTVRKAVELMQIKRDEASREVKKLRTASECKEAVLDLIREHEAAPASFRDAVDALPVAL